MLLEQNDERNVIFNSIVDAHTCRRESCHKKGYVAIEVHGKHHHVSNPAVQQWVDAIVKKTEGVDEISPPNASPFRPARTARSAPPPPKRRHTYSKHRTIRLRSDSSIPEEEEEADEADEAGEADEAVHIRPLKRAKTTRASLPARMAPSSSQQAPPWQHSQESYSLQMPQFSTYSESMYVAPRHHTPAPLGPNGYYRANLAPQRQQPQRDPFGAPRAAEMGDWQPEWQSSPLHEYGRGANEEEAYQTEARMLGLQAEEEEDEETQE